MPGLDPKVAIHRLAVDPAAKPVKQARRRLQPDLVEPVINEIKRLIEAEFIEESHYPEWLANIVVVKKKNGQREISVDFRNLNAACPKDFFPLTITEMIIDATISHEILSFMDGDGTEWNLSGSSLSLLILLLYAHRKLQDPTEGVVGGVQSAMGDEMDLDAWLANPGTEAAGTSVE